MATTNSAKKRFLNPLTISVSAAMLASTLSVGSLHAAENPFATTELNSGFMLASKDGEGKCGEGKCGEGKSAESKDAEGKCGESKSDEGKCGEGKCGADKTKKKDMEGKCGEGKCGGKS